MGPIWGQQDPGGPHVGPMNFAIWDVLQLSEYMHRIQDNSSTKATVLAGNTKWHISPTLFTVVDCAHCTLINIYRFQSITIRRCTGA